MDLYLFTPNGDTSDSDFLRDPFLPLTITAPGDTYRGIQLLTILSTDGDTCPFYGPTHKEQLFNADTAAQSQVENSLTFYFPANHESAQYAVEGNLVAFQDLDGNWQLFEIITVDDYHDDTLYKQVYAVNAGQSELADEWINSVTITSATAQSALSSVLNGTRWQVGQVDDLGTQSANLARMNVLQALQTLIQTWGGELRFRVTVSGSRITGMYVDWLQQRGSRTGKRFVYGKDMTSVHPTRDLSGLKTALYGYGKRNDDGTYVTFASVAWSKANGDPVDKPAGQEWVGDPDALAKWGRAGGTRHRFGNYVDGNQTDPATLLQETWTALQSMSQPLVSYQMSVVDLEQIAGYSHERVRLGDTVAVIDTDFSPELRLTARVVEIDRDLVNPQNTQLVLGNFLPTTVDTSRQVANLQGQVNDIQAGSVQVGDPINAASLRGVIDILKTSVQNSQAYVYITPTDGILVLDAPQDQNPTKAIKLGGGILAIANSKDANGNWDWKTFGTGDGFVADLIQTGMLQGVSIILGGSGNGNGQFTLEDSSGNPMITMDNTGIKLSNGATMLGGSGVISTLVFESSGWYSGWQSAGWWDDGGGPQNFMALLFAYIPSNFVITSATLYTKAMPVKSYKDASTYQWFNVTNARLWTALGSDVLNMYGNGYGSAMVVTPQTKTEITSSAWGGKWNPGTSGVVVKSADVLSYLTPGQRVFFGVDSGDSSPPSTQYPQTGGMVQFELVVTGYKNG
jgi:phage minor structural protein